MIELVFKKSDPLLPTHFLALHMVPLPYKVEDHGDALKFYLNVDAIDGYGIAATTGALFTPVMKIVEDYKVPPKFSSGTVKGD